MACRRRRDREVLSVRSPGEFPAQKTGRQEKRTASDGRAGSLLGISINSEIKGIDVAGSLFAGGYPVEEGKAPAKGKSSGEASRREGKNDLRG